MLAGCNGWFAHAIMPSVSNPVPFIVRHLFKDFAVFLQTGLFCQCRVHTLVSGLVVLHPADNG
jgi:hypothetical protein